MHPLNKSIGHIPVLISDFRKLFPKINGIWVDGTFGFGGYSKYLLEAGVEKFILSTYAQNTVVLSYQRLLKIKLFCSVT